MDAMDTTDALDSADIIRLVDVGGAGGLQKRWLEYASRILPIMFEPNPDEAARLRSILAEQCGAGTVVEAGLSNLPETKTLHITRHWGCTSLLEPNTEFLNKYRVHPRFRVVKTADVKCVRYDALYAQRLVPAPDVIKIDVQGYEYEVLLGFGALLDNCLGIEIETHLYPIYRNQKLMHEMVAFLGVFGFMLRAIKPKANFDGDIVELDAWFTKDRARWKGLDDHARKKFAVIADVWGLKDYASVIDD